jgi:hypothetical protein
MAKSPPRERAPIPAPKTKQAEHFQLAASTYVGRLVQDSLTHMVAPQNKLRLHHGRSWGDGRDGLGGSQGNLKLSSAQTTITFDSVMRNDVVALRDFVKLVSEKMSADMTKHIYATVSAAADSVGNVVSMAAAGSPSNAFLEMLQKVEFGVNSKGKVSLPSIHLSPEAWQKMLDDMNSQGPEFREKVERIKHEKGLAALQREQARQDKYRK